MYGDIQIYAIDLDWGQTLQAQTVLEKADERGGRYWYLDIISPFGAAATVPSDAPEDRYSGGSSESQTVLNAMTTEVR